MTRNLTGNLTIRCSPADLETVDRLRGDRRSRGELLRTLIREAGDVQSVTVPRAWILHIAREMGVGEENADLLAHPAVTRGVRQAEDER
ncbi:MAG: ribbon-helix-helix protein, CopG family [Methanospirillum sp.]